MFWILSQLNILCTSLVKSYHTKITINRYSPFTCYDHFTCCQTYWISSKQSDSYIRNVQYVIRSRNCALNFTAVRYFLHKCSECSRVTCFSAYRSSWKQKNLAPSSSDLSLVNFFLWRVYNKYCIIKTSKTYIWSAYCYNLHCLVR